MGVHSPQVFALAGGMHASTPPATRPFEAGDPEWVADLFDELLRVMRRAAKARRMLASIDPALLRAGRQLRAGRVGQS